MPAKKKPRAGRRTTRKTIHKKHKLDREAMARIIDAAERRGIAKKTKKK